MLLTRANLLIVGLVKKASGSRLDNVHIEKDGTTVCSDGKVIVAVSPIDKKLREQIPRFQNESTSINSDINRSVGGTITAETIKEVLKYIPQDKVFKGLLENCEFNGGEFTFNDGKRTHTVKAKLFERMYISWKKVFAVAGRRRAEYQFAMNLKDLLNLLNVIDKVCNNKSKENPIFIEMNKEGNMIVRGINPKTGQRVMGIVNAYQGTGISQWLRKNLWETKLLRGIGIKI